MVTLVTVHATQSKAKSLIPLHYLFEKQQAKYFSLRTPTPKEKLYHSSPAFTADPR